MLPKPDVSLVLYNFLLRICCLDSKSTAYSRPLIVCFLLGFRTSRCIRTCPTLPKNAWGICGLCFVQSDSIAQSDSNSMKQAIDRVDHQPIYAILDLAPRHSLPFESVRKPILSRRLASALVLKLPTKRLQIWGTSVWSLGRFKHSHPKLFNLSPNKLAYKGGGWLCPNIGGLAHLFDFAPPCCTRHDNNQIGQLHRLVLVMRDEHGG